MISVTAYHGTASDFEYFRGVTWFASNTGHGSAYAVRNGASGARLIRAQIRLDRPYCVPFRRAMMLADEEIESLKAAGYDGIVGASNYSTVYAVFCPIQIDRGV